MTPQPIVEKATGGGVALPFWLAFMKAAYIERPLPSRDFPVPDDVSLMHDYQGNLVPYQRGRMPERFLHGVAVGNFVDPSEF